MVSNKISILTVVLEKAFTYQSIWIQPAVLKNRKIRNILLCLSGDIEINPGPMNQ